MWNQKKVRKIQIKLDNVERQDTNDKDGKLKDMNTKVKEIK